MPINYSQFNIANDFSKDFAVNFSMPSFNEFKDFADDGLDYFNANVRLRAMTKGFPQLVYEVFRDFVLIYIKNLIEENYENLEAGKGESFEKTVYDCSEKIIESLLQFRVKLEEKGLNRYLDFAVNIAGIAVISCLAYYCPVLAIVIPATGIFNKFKEFISKEGLANYLNTIKIEKDNLQNLKSIPENPVWDLRLFLKNNLYSAAEKQKVIKAYIDLPEENKQTAASLINKINEANNIFKNKNKLSNVIEDLKKNIFSETKINHHSNDLLNPKKIKEKISDIQKENIICKKIIKIDSYIDEMLEASGLSRNKVDEIPEFATFKELKNIITELKAISKYKKLSKDFIECIGVSSLSEYKVHNSIPKNKNNERKNSQTNQRVAGDANNKWVHSTEANKSNAKTRERAPG